MEIGVKVKLVNHNLVAAIEATGCKSVNEFCVKYGFNPSGIGRLVNLKDTPSHPYFCARLEKALNLPMDVLFPEDLVEQVSKKPQTRFYYHKEVECLSLSDPSVGQLSYMPKSESEAEEEIEEVNGDLTKVLDSLNARDVEILKYRFGFGNKKCKSFREIGSTMGLSNTRVMQIQEHAMRVIRERIKRWRGTGKLSGDQLQNRLDGRTRRFIRKWEKDNHRKWVK